jgi:hypothetical protein
MVAVVQLGWAGFALTLLLLLLKKGPLNPSARDRVSTTSVAGCAQFLSYMWNPLSWAMEAAAIIAVALLDWADFALILALLLLNATISYVEESSAVLAWRRCC